ncbi:MAG TPA: hypothetical protein PLV41_09240 [Miltoncostaeales bacterium]|nr:hypothetical protein [Miltoncostaeales bacterium]
MTAAVQFADIRASVALLILAMFGGMVSVAWGNRRLTRPNRLAMVDARTQLQVLLDALRARTAVLTRRDDLPSAARREVDAVVMEHVFIDATLARAATADEVDRLRPQLHACLVTLEHAAESVGLNLPATQPFAGLCSIDPQHGAATSSPDGDGLCRACIAAIGTEVELPVRMVAKDGRAVPFDEIDLSSPSHDHSPFDGEGDR